MLTSVLMTSLGLLARKSTMHFGQEMQWDSVLYVAYQAQHQWVLVPNLGLYSPRLRVVVVGGWVHFHRPGNPRSRRLRRGSQQYSVLCQVALCKYDSSIKSNLGEGAGRTADNAEWGLQP